MTNAVLTSRHCHLAVLVATVLSLALAASEEQRGSQEKKKFDYCVIGAGPAGLQMAYYLMKAGRDYMVFEKSNMTGYFFGMYPKHRRLISINKLYTGQQNPEYNLRHDWNSLLSDDPSLLFKHFSRDYFPHADTMVKYLDEYRRKLGLSVQFDSEARNIRRLPKETPTGHRFQFEDQRGDTYSCKYMLMANGMSKPNQPYFEGHKMTVGYEEVSTDVADFEAKTVLILGRGNSAFETANHVAGVANYVHLLASSPPRFAWSTHYVGDLRYNVGLEADRAYMWSRTGLYTRTVRCRAMYTEEKRRKLKNVGPVSWHLLSLRWLMGRKLDRPENSMAPKFIQLIKALESTAFGVT